MRTTKGKEEKTKQVRQIIMMFVLLLVVLPACAQRKVSGKLTNDGHTMEWSVSGITVTKKGQPKLETSVMTPAGVGSLKQEIEGTVAPGTTITADLKKVSGKKMPKIYIDFDYRKKGDPVFMPSHTIQLEEKEYTSKSFTVPSNAESVEIFITYRTPAPQPRSYALDMNVSLWLKVKGGTTATPSPVKPENRERRKYTGTIERFGEKMKFTLSGGVVTYKDGPYPPRIDRILSPNSTASGVLRVDVEPGETVSLTVERLKGSSEWYKRCEAQLDGKMVAGEGKAHYSIKVPNDKEYFNGKVIYYGKNSALGFDILFNVKNKVTLAEEISPTSWNDVLDDNNCEICGSEYSEFKPNGYSTGAKYSCTKDPNKKMHDIESGKVIYGNTKIWTDDQELGINYGDQENTIIIEKNSEVEFTNDQGVQIWTVIKGGIRGINLKPLNGTGGSFLFYTPRPQVQAIPFGTVFVIQSNNNTSHVYLLSGSMEVTSKKTGKKVMLKPGQASTVGIDGEQKVQQFDIKKAAKKFGITDAQLQGQVSTSTVATKRYELQRGIVKYKVTKGSQQGVLAKAFDMYGVYERRELRMGNQTSIALTAGAESYALDKNKKTARRTKDADLNFLNLNETLMKKLKLQKKGTATVMGKKCDHYVGTNVEYYVWKGLVIKKVQKGKNGATTIHEVTSIEQPASIDPKMFKMPDGYTVK